MFFPKAAHQHQAIGIMQCKKRQQRMGVEWPCLPDHRWENVVKETFCPLHIAEDILEAVTFSPPPCQLSTFWFSSEKAEPVSLELLAYCVSFILYSKATFGHINQRVITAAVRIAPMLTQNRLISVQLYNVCKMQIQPISQPTARPSQKCRRLVSKTVAITI